MILRLLIYVFLTIYLLIIVLKESKRLDLESTYIIVEFSQGSIRYYAKDRSITLFSQNYSKVKLFASDIEAIKIIDKLNFLYENTFKLECKKYAEVFPDVD